MKTLVAPKHAPGPYVNGYDNCHARHLDGMCPGVRTAQWLNSLGSDNEKYYGPSSKRTNGDVRTTYLQENWHVVPLEPELHRLSAEIRRLSAELRRAKTQLKRLIISKVEAV